MKCQLLQKGFPLLVQVPTRDDASSLSWHRPSLVRYGFLPVSAARFPWKIGPGVKEKAVWAWSPPDTHARGGQDVPGTQRVIPATAARASALSAQSRHNACCTQGIRPVNCGEPELALQLCSSSAGMQAMGYPGRSNHHRLECNWMQDTFYF